MRPRRARDGLRVPLQLQMLEAEYLDRTYSVALPNAALAIPCTYERLPSPIEGSTAVRSSSEIRFRPSKGIRLASVGSSGS